MALELHKVSSIEDKIQVVTNHMKTRLSLKIEQIIVQVVDNEIPIGRDSILVGWNGNLVDHEIRIVLPHEFHDKRYEIILPNVEGFQGNELRDLEIELLKLISTFFRFTIELSDGDREICDPSNEDEFYTFQGTELTSINSLDLDVFFGFTNTDYGILNFSDDSDREYSNHLSLSGYGTKENIELFYSHLISELQEQFSDIAHEHFNNLMRD